MHEAVDTHLDAGAEDPRQVGNRAVHCLRQDWAHACRIIEARHLEATRLFRRRSFQNVDLTEEGTEALVATEAPKHGIHLTVHMTDS